MRSDLIKESSKVGYEILEDISVVFKSRIIEDTRDRLQIPGKIKF